MASAKSIEVLGLLYSNIKLLLYSFTCIVVDVKSSLELNCEIVRGFDASSKRKAMTDSYVRCP